MIMNHVHNLEIVVIIWKGKESRLFVRNESGDIHGYSVVEKWSRNFWSGTVFFDGNY